MYEKIKKLCEERGISITRLCKEITGSSGNLPTWKKGNISSGNLVKIAQYFDVSADSILGIEKSSKNIDFPQENAIYLMAKSGQRMKITLDSEDIKRAEEELKKVFPDKFASEETNDGNQ